MGEISDLPHIEFASLSFNPVSDIQDLHSSSLRGLNLNDTNVTEISIQNLPELKYLSVQNCRIAKIQSSLHGGLQFIDLENTGISDLTLIGKAFPNLVQVDVDDGVVVDRMQNTFQFLEYLNDEKVEPSRHPISQVEYEVKSVQDLLTNYLCEQHQCISELIDGKLENLVRLKYIV